MGADEHNHEPLNRVEHRPQRGLEEPDLIRRWLRMPVSVAGATRTSRRPRRGRRRTVVAPANGREQHDAEQIDGRGLVFGGAVGDRLVGDRLGGASSSSSCSATSIGEVTAEVPDRRRRPRRRGHRRGHERQQRRDRHGGRKNGAGGGMGGPAERGVATGAAEAARHGHWRGRGAPGRGRPAQARARAGAPRGRRRPRRRSDASSEPCRTARARCRAERLPAPKRTGRPTRIVTIVVPALNGAEQPGLRLARRGLPGSGSSRIGSPLAFCSTRERFARARCCARRSGPLPFSEELNSYSGSSAVWHPAPRTRTGSACTDLRCRPVRWPGPGSRHAGRRASPSNRAGLLRCSRIPCLASSASSPITGISRTDTGASSSGLRSARWTSPSRMPLAPWKLSVCSREACS